MREYSLKFTQLSHYSPKMVTNMRNRMSFLFMDFPTFQLKGKIVMLISDMDIPMLTIHI